MYYDWNDIKRYKIGTVIQIRPNTVQSTRIGHIIGFGLNCTGEVILEVAVPTYDRDNQPANLVEWLHPCNVVNIGD